ncbi:MAG: UDP-N-acetylmuramoyl-tripeptide--D-alanyl-D-alanine ligase [Thermoleophilaceae bacterium]
MMDRDAAWVAEAAGGRLLAGDRHEPGPERAVIDTRQLRPGDLFVGLRGTRVDGGEFAPRALEAGAWGVLVDASRAGSLATDRPLVAADDPLVALQRLAAAWRRELGCKLVAITGSTGKTSTKDILAAMLRSQLRTHANHENLNTEIGLPLSILEAPPGTEAMVLEMAMRGAGQIAELAAIAEPDVGVIVNVGPVHLELLGDVEKVAAAKAELIRDLPAGAACVVPASEPLLDAHLRDDLDTWTFGPGGQVALLSFDAGVAQIEARGERLELELPFSEAHNLLNALAAMAAARALGVRPAGALEVRFSSLRGEIVELPGGVTLVNDCYNANPMSMRAALDTLAGSPAERRIAVLGTMAELGEDSPRFHSQAGAQAAARGIDVLVTVGQEALAYADGFDGESHAVAGPEEAAALLDELAQPGDRVLLKGSRSVGLERVLDSLGAPGERG